MSEPSLFVVIEVATGAIDTSTGHPIVMTRSLGVFSSRSKAKKRAETVYRCDVFDKVIVLQDTVEYVSDRQRYHLTVVEVSVLASRTVYVDKDVPSSTVYSYDRKRVKAEDYGTFPPPMEKNDYY